MCTISLIIIVIQKKRINHHYNITLVAGKQCIIKNFCETVTEQLFEELQVGVNIKGKFDQGVNLQGKVKMLRMKALIIITIFRGCTIIKFEHNPYNLGSQEMAPCYWSCLKRKCLLCLVLATSFYLTERIVCVLNCMLFHH